MTTTVAKTLLILCSVLILVIANNSILSPIMLIAKQARAVTITTTSPSSSSFRSDSNIATITNVQLPGILPNNNRSSPSASSSSNFGSNIISNSNPSTNNHQSAGTTTSSPLVHRNTRARPAIGGPTLDPNLKVEQIINTGLKSTTSMAFWGPNDILVLEKDTGIVHRILNGKILQPLLDVNVANEAERGLLGIAIANGSNDENAENENRNANTDNHHVFLYYTESGGEKDGDDKPAAGGIAPAGNRLYRYYLHESGNDVKLTNPLLLLNLPASPPPERAGTEKNHNGGKVLIGPDKNVYVGVGDGAGHRGQAENNPNGAIPDGTGGILRVTQDGQIVDNPPLYR